MNFKEALIAHLSGDKVEGKGSMTGNIWGDFLELVKCVEIGSIREDFAQDYEFRIVPRTMLCNGVEVYPAEKQPEHGDFYYVPNIGFPESPLEYTWYGTGAEHEMFKNKIIHMTEESAIVHGKAMLILTEK